MLTACFTCNQVVAVGELGGNAGLPSLDPMPKGAGPHPLSRILSVGLDEQDDETFGCIYSGLEAIGVFTHAFDDYRAFLVAHSGHRLFMWNEEDDTQLPDALRSQAAVLVDVAYEPPAVEADYVKRNLVFWCSRCECGFQSESGDWVRPFEPRLLQLDAMKVFRHRTAKAAEMNVHDAEPFGILFTDLDDWLEEHEAHGVVLSLSRHHRRRE